MFMDVHNILAPYVTKSKKMVLLLKIDIRYIESMSFVTFVCHVYKLVKTMHIVAIIAQPISPDSLV